MRRIQWLCLFSFFLLFRSVGYADAILPKDVYFPTRDFHSSFPYITGETFRDCSDHVFDPVSEIHPENICAGDTIFVFFNYLEYFFERVHPRIRFPYILITHHFFGDSDSSVPGDKLASFLDDPKLIAWLGINIDRIHPKLISLPIGVSTPFYHYGSVQTLDVCIAHKEQVEKKFLLYMNFAIHTFPIERQRVYDLFKNSSYCFHPSRALEHCFQQGYPKKHSDYLTDLAACWFCLSPRGNGLDCFRTWEALLMGSIPIVKTSLLDSLYENLPVLIVQDWEEISEEFLQQKCKEMQSKEYNLEKLYMPYWLEKIQELKASAKTLNISIELFGSQGDG